MHLIEHNQIFLSLIVIHN